jgi:hypothetical protein
MVIKLPLPASNTISGPLLSAKEGVLQVKYDWESDDGSVMWCAITFTDVLTWTLYDSSVCPAEVITSPHEIDVALNGRHLEGIRAAWEESVGWSASKDKEGFKLYNVYFDDSAAVSVVARDCCVERIDS